jgi:coiled-coil-helix-coiled-coil-helix domain-containing protein 10
MLSGIGSTIVQGMAFGTGSAIAHRAVGAVAGSMSGGSGGEAAPAAPEYATGAMSNNNNNVMNKPDACLQDRQIYYDCIRDNRDDQAVCSFLLEQLKSCQQNQMYS